MKILKRTMPVLQRCRCLCSFSPGIRTHFGHAHGHHEHEHDHHIQHHGTAGEKIAKVGLLADILLSGVKGSAGYLSGSTALIADAAHSLSDVALSAVAVWSLKAAKAPKDSEHPYGHAKFETVGALAISTVLLATGCGIAWHAFEVLQVLLPTLANGDINSMVHLGSHDHSHSHGGHHHGIDMEHKVLALSAAITSIGVKEGLYWVTKSIGDRQGSQLLKASAWHHRSDAISSVVALIGVGGSIMGIPWLDPAAGILVSGMIVRAGLQTGYQSLQELVDKGVSENVLSPIRKTVLTVQGVQGCHDLRGRRAGSSVYVDVHIEVDPFLSVSAAHNIGEAVRQEIHRKHLFVAEAYVHIDPASSCKDQISSETCNSENDHTKDSLVEDSKRNSNSKSSSNGVNLYQQVDVEGDIRRALSSPFSEVADVRHVRCHFLQDKVMAEVEISMNPDMLIRDAMSCAEEIESSLLEKVSSVSLIKVQLRLKD